MQKMGEFEWKIVADPTVFKVNVLPAHSDHVSYASNEEMQKGESSYRKSLNGIWQFSYAKNPQLAVSGFEKTDYDCTGWDEIRVPSNMQFEGYDVPAYVNTQYPWDGREEIVPGQVPTIFNPTGSYVTYFDVPDNWKKTAVYISFQGVESGFALWCNGKYVGYSEDSFTPSEFNLSKYLTKDGKGNKLAVRVFKWTASSWLEDQDMFRLSGIFRDVYLYTTPACHVYDMKVRGLVDESLCQGELEVTLDYRRDGKGDASVSGTTEYALYDADGNEVLHGESDNDQEVKLAHILEAPLLWSAEDPYLYELVLNVKDSRGRVVEVITQPVGFRRFEMKDGIMTLNGKRIVFRGVNRHEFSCDTGRAVDPETVLRDILEMKRNNINGVRTSHYPDATTIYDLCDEYGLYMIAENNMETHGYWDAILRGKLKISDAIPGNRMEYLPMMLDRVNSTYQRDKNHPSILIWSCGNESFGGKVIYEMSEFFRKVDPDRLVHYEGIFNDRRIDATSDMESQMYTKVVDVKKFLEEHPSTKENPGKPFIMCEYAHSMGNSLGDMYEYMDLADEEPRFQGGFIWDYVDQSVRMKNRFGEEFQGYGGDHGERPTDYDFSGNGIVDGTRRPYAKIREVKWCYQPLVIRVTDRKVTVFNRHLFTNSDTYDCVVTVYKDGAFYAEAPLATSVEPLSSKTYDLPIAKGEEPGEYAFQVSFKLAEDTDWADKGYEIAFGEAAVTVASHEKKEVETPPFTVIHGLVNTGVRGRNFEVLLSNLKGGLVSYRYGGKEMIEWIPRPNFWRAPTSNDLGNRFPSRSGIWKIASEYQDFVDFDANPYCGSEESQKYPKIREAKDHVDVTWKKYLPTIPRSSVMVTYRIFANGTIRVLMDYSPAQGLPPMPEFGFMFKLNADYDRVEYYGLGPDENYCDRNGGAKLGIYSMNMEDVCEHYMVPQETGNRTGVRWAKVTDYRGRGLLFRGVNDKKKDDPYASKPGTMEFSALPYTPEQLEEAGHAWELPRRAFTVVRCSLKQMGVGGDDSWGAPTHDEFLVHADAPLHFEFEFRGI